jgi:hypothetical protein
MIGRNPTMTNALRHNDSVPSRSANVIEAELAANKRKLETLRAVRSDLSIILAEFRHVFATDPAMGSTRAQLSKVIGAALKTGEHRHPNPPHYTPGASTEELTAMWERASRVHHIQARRSLMVLVEICTKLDAYDATISSLENINRNLVNELTEAMIDTNIIPS